MRVFHGNTANKVRTTIAQIKERRALGKRLQRLCLEEDTLGDITRPMDIIDKSAVYNMTIRRISEDSRQVSAIREKIYDGSLDELVGILDLGSLKGLVEFLEEKFLGSAEERNRRETCEKDKDIANIAGTIGFIVFLSSFCIAIGKLYSGDLVIGGISLGIANIAIGAMFYALRKMMKAENEEEEPKE